jgi:monoamine oxidase
MQETVPADPAVQVGQLDEAERRKAILGGLVELFGEKAGSPVDYIEHNWSAERYSGGGMLGHAPTGVLTQFGHALREPCGAYPLGRNRELRRHVRLGRWGHSLG